MTVGWLSARRPQGRDVALAVLFAVVYTAIILLALDHAWSPADDTLRKFDVAGACTFLVLLTRERFPLTTLMVIVLSYPAIYGTGLRTEFHLLPILLAAYTVAAQGRLSTVWVVLAAESGALRICVGLEDWQGMLTTSDIDFYWWNPDRIALVFAVTAGVVLLGRAAYRQRLATAQVLARNRELERLRAVETDQVVTAERTRIARELHDVVAHHISAVVIRAQAADRVADNRPGETREAVRWIAANGQETLAAMRHVVRVLRSAETGGALTPQTTLAELPEIADRMAAVGLPVELRLPSVVPILPAAVELATVRIVQEALTNVLVHARATRALVEVRLTDDGIRLEVHDDGSATSPPTTPIQMVPVSSPPPAGLREPVLPLSASVLGGNGLIGMRERAVSCGGLLSIGTSPLGGWVVTAVLRSGLSSVRPVAERTRDDHRSTG